MWVHDLRVAIRAAVKAPSFSGTVVAALAIAIAPATATFSVVYHVLLAPLPVKAEEHLVLFQKKLQLANTLVPFPYSDLAALRGTVSYVRVGVRCRIRWRVPRSDAGR